jgi:hypothetical protein
MAVFTARSRSCGTSFARRGRQYRHILLLYIFVEHINVYCTETPIISKLEFDGRVFCYERSGRSNSLS